MISGIYFVEFKANNNDFGQGLVTIDDGKINGGDHAFLFQGRLDIYQGEIKSIIEVTHYRGAPNSIFGSIRKFTLNLTGKANNDNFEITGGVANMANATISIVGKKVADLYK